MNILKPALTAITFLYLCYHLYTYGPGAFNVTVFVIFILSVIANYFKDRRESSSLKANEESRQKRAEREHKKKQKRNKK